MKAHFTQRSLTVRSSACPSSTLVVLDNSRANHVLAHIWRRVVYKISHKASEPFNVDTMVNTEAVHFLVVRQLHQLRGAKGGYLAEHAGRGCVTRAKMDVDLLHGSHYDRIHGESLGRLVELLLGKEPGLIVSGIHLANAGEELRRRDEIVIPRRRFQQHPHRRAVFLYRAAILAIGWVLQAVAESMEPDAACGAVGFAVLAASIAVAYVLCGCHSAPGTRCRAAFGFWAAVTGAYYIHMDDLARVTVGGSSKVDKGGGEECDESWLDLHDE